MATWNYRVVKATNKVTGETLFYLSEVYYGDDGKPYGYTDSSLIADGDTLDGLQELRDRLNQAFEEPVLDAEKDFGHWEDIIDDE